MKNLRIIYHLARADFLERSRRYSFLIMLGLVVFLGYQVGIENIQLTLGRYRGEYNSAWISAAMSLVSSFFLGWLGFYLVKGSVARDRETGVGQIMATTPLTRPLYMFGKWLSNFILLVSMTSILALAGIAIQLARAENTQIDLYAYLTPFLFITFPLLALVAALAVLHESISFLQSGFGNIVHFLGFNMIIPIFLENDALKNYFAFEPLGLGLLSNLLGDAVIKIYPDYDGSFSLGMVGAGQGGTFVWNGVEWTGSILFARFTIFTVAIALTFLASAFFDRFDPSRSKPKRMKNAASTSTLEAVSSAQAGSAPVHLGVLSASAGSFSFFRLLFSEIKLLLKGKRWWWYAIAGGFIIAGASNTPEIARQYILMFAWVWPILLWSAIGNREIQHNTQQMVFSSAAPLWRQLPAQWTAGLLITLLTGSGVALNLFRAGDSVGLLAWTSAAIFIPSLALALGVWSNSHKLFEILYMTIWYIGPLNKVPQLDFLGANSDGNLGFFISFSVVLILLALIGRARQLQN